LQRYALDDDDINVLDVLMLGAKVLAKKVKRLIKWLWVEARIRSFRVKEVEFWVKRGFLHMFLQVLGLVVQYSVSKSAVSGSGSGGSIQRIQVCSFWSVMFLS
nr:hypothetical protein [Tanacetum cinerariifolium]